MTNLKCAAGALLVGVLFPCLAEGANICPNFSFELGTGASGNFQTLNPGSTAITDWRITGNPVDLFFNQGSQGTRSVDLTANVGQNGTLETTLPTVAGVTYSVDLDAAGYHSSNTTADQFKQFTITTLDAGTLTTLLPVTTYTVDAGPLNTQPVFLSYGGVTFTATSSSTLLQIHSLHTVSFDGPTVDNVRVVALPEPTGLPLAAAILMGVVGRRRR
jgi:Protein of unknown function (DUF642)